MLGVGLVYVRVPISQGWTPRSPSRQQSPILRMGRDEAFSHIEADTDSITIVDPNRIPHSCLPIVYGNLITPSTCISAQVYDIANRRWYEVNVPKDIRDEEWIADTLACHIKNATIPFNVITFDTTGHATYSTRPIDTVGRQIPLNLKFRYSGTIFPVIHVEEVLEKRFLDRSIDLCMWNGDTCIFKQIEFEEDIPNLQREILVREEMLRKIGSDPNLDMGQCGISPILAVVVDAETRLTQGIILPYCGESLDRIANDTAQSSTIVCVRHLSSLVQAVSYLSKLGSVHGDICERNVCIKADEGDMSSQVALVDFGEVAPHYKGDVEAAGRLLRWCEENLKGWSKDERTRIKAAAACLQRGDGPDGASEDLLAAALTVLRK